jgi:hypothetical protein
VPPPAANVVETRRRAPSLVETTFEGRVTGPMIDEACASYRTLGGRSTWLIFAEKTRSYSPDAVDRAVKEFAALHREHGLDQIVAIILAPLVRMGASIVSASLRTLGSGLVIHVVDSNDAAQAQLRTRSR